MRREVVFLFCHCLLFSAVFFLLDKIYFVFAVMDRKKGGGHEREGGGRRESGEAGMIREEREIKWLTGDGG